jgi:hypothetical protein
MLDAHMVSPASESIRRTFPHCSIVAALRDLLVVVIDRSNRVARAPVMPLRRDIVMGPPTLGGRRIHDGSEARQRYLQLTLKDKQHVQSGSVYIPATAPREGWRDNSCDRLSTTLICVSWAFSVTKRSNDAYGKRRLQMAGFRIAQ